MFPEIYLSNFSIAYNLVFLFCHELTLSFFSLRNYLTIINTIMRNLTERSRPLINRRYARFLAILSINESLTYLSVAHES